MWFENIEFNESFSDCCAFEKYLIILTHFGYINQTVIMFDIIRAKSVEKVPSNMHKMHRFSSSYACAYYHPGILLSILAMILLADSEGPDQTAQMCSLI